MSKKKLVFVCMIISLAFSYGLLVGHYKVFPYAVFSDIKFLFTNQIPQESIHRPQIYQNSSTVKDLIRINDENDILQKRIDLIKYIWMDQGFPYETMPNKIETNFQDPKFSDLTNLEKIDVITIDMEYGMNSISYLFLAKNSNNKLILYHQGHAEQSFTDDKDKIQFFLDRGYSVMMFSMITHGLNNEPVVEFPEFGKLRLNSHDHFKLIESHTFHPIKYFVEPIAVSLNYVDKEFDFQSYSMMGLSGGGWTTILYSAIDPRITQSYSVAGSFPIWLRADSRNFGDYEQTLPDLYRIANYEELYVIDSFGDDRKLILIYNTFDPCCFSGSLYKEFPFEESIKTKLNDLGTGEFIVLLDDSHNEHKISEWAMNKIINLMETKN